MLPTHNPPISTFTRVKLIFPLSDFWGLDWGLVGTWHRTGSTELSLIMWLNHLSSVPFASVALKPRESAMESTESKEYILCLRSSPSILVQALTLSLLQLPFTPCTVLTGVSSFMPQAYFCFCGTLHPECPFLILPSIFTRFKGHTLTDNLRISSSLLFLASVFNSTGALSVLL